jgi:dihydroorotate dehydrogenase (fumarate)
VIASLNGVTPGAWVEHAKLLEEAGADALELNVYYVSSSPRLAGIDVERRYIELVRSVRQAIGIPLAVKLSPYFSSVANMAHQLVHAGADGLVLFNRFYQPDLGLDSLEVTPRLVLSTSEELRLPLRWIAILYKEVPASLAASTGVHTAADAVKVLMAGADVAMMTSALLRNGPEHLRAVEAGLRDWLEERGMQTVGHLRGLRGQRSVRDPGAWERANYITMLAGYPDEVHTEAR